MTKKRFSNVSEMINSISDDTSFKQEFEDRLRSRQIVKSLIAMRVGGDISQSDVAKELGCTQSRVSKIENGYDGELRLRDLEAYAKVLGRDVQLLFSDRGMGLADQVKWHALGMRNALLRLVKLAHKDDEIVQGVARLHVEAFVNIMKFLQDTSSKLPPRPDNGKPYVRIVSSEEAENSDFEDLGDAGEPAALPFEKV